MPLFTTLCRLVPVSADRHAADLLDRGRWLLAGSSTWLAVLVYVSFVGALLAGVVPDGHLGTAVGVLTLTAGLRVVVGFTTLFSSA